MKHIFLRLSMLLLMLGLSLSYGLSQSPAKSGGQGYVDPPATGNAQADEEAHIKAKTQWIKDNPEAYRQAGGDPESVLKPAETVENTAPIFKEGPAFANKHSFSLAKVEAVAIVGAAPTKAALDQETLGLQKEFPTASTQFQLDGKGNIRILVPGRADLRGQEQRNGQDIVWTFKSSTCETCSKVLHLKLEAGSPGQLVYLMDAEDSEADMAYRFVFQPIGTN
jgi:hypothetical protein